MSKKKRSYIIAGVIIVLAFAVAGFVYYAYKSPNGFYARQHSDIRNIEKGDAVYTNLAGDPVSLKSFEGKELLINVWASWSPFTAGDFQVLAKIKEKYGDSIEIIAMNRMETKETAQAYLDYIQAPANINFILDGGDNFFSTINGYAMPETVIYDEIGNIYYHKHGSLDFEEINAAVSQRLSTTAP